MQHLIADLQEPFASGTTEYVDVTSTYQTILKSLKPPSRTASFDWVYFFTEASSIAGAIAFATGLGDLGTALGLVSAVGEFDQDVTPSSSNGDSRGVLRGEVSDLVGQISDQNESYSQVTLRLEDILLGDVGKMTTVYTKMHQKNAANYGWSWTNSTTIAAAQALNANAVSQSYSAILPTAWGMYALLPDLPENMPADNVANYRCSGFGQGQGPALWAGAPSGNQLLAPPTSTRPIRPTSRPTGPTPTSTSTTSPTTRPDPPRCRPRTSRIRSSQRPRRAASNTRPNGCALPTTHPAPCYALRSP